MSNVSVGVILIPACCTSEHVAKEVVLNVICFSKSVSNFIFKTAENKMNLQEYQAVKIRWEKAKLAQARIDGELKNLKETAKKLYSVNSLKELENKVKETSELVDTLNKEIDEELQELEKLMAVTS